MAYYKLGERPYENILKKYNVTNPLALVIYDDIYKKGYADGYAKATDDFFEELQKYEESDGWIRLKMSSIYEIAEQMKGSEENAFN